MANHNVRQEKITMIRQQPPASEGVTEPGCANTLPVMFPVSGVRAANVAQFLNYLLLPFRANRGQQDPKRLLPIILL